MNLDNQELYLKIKANDKNAFDSLFIIHYASLCRFAYTIIHSQTLAEEAVQDVFVRL